MKRYAGVVFALLLAGLLVSPRAFAEGPKIAHVDLRRAFYEYEKSKVFDKELNDITNKKTEERNKKVEEIKKMRDEADKLNGEAKAKKEKEIDDKINSLNEFDRVIRQEVLTKKNDMFKVVIDDIQKIVDNMGKQGGYDYIIDSRSVMFAKEGQDLTDQVLKELNKK
jgi:outer membrane protein